MARDVRLTMRLIDQVSGPGRAITASLGAVRGAANGIVSVASAPARAVGAMGKQFRRSSYEVAPLSAGIALAGRAAAESVYNYEFAGNKMQAFGLLAEDQRKQLEEYAQVLNKDFPQTNKDILEAAQELFRAGFTFEQAMGSLRGSLVLSMAGDLSNREATDIATNVMTAMKMPMQTSEQVGESMSKVLDALAYAATKSNTDVRMMGETFKYVAPMASAAGMRLEEVSAISMIMANNGIRASEAGVALRSALVRMARPTKPMLQALGRLNIEMSDFIEYKDHIEASSIGASLLPSGIDIGELGLTGEIQSILDDKSLGAAPMRMAASLTDLIVKAMGDETLRSDIADTINDAVMAGAQNVDLIGFLAALRDKGATITDVAQVFDVRQGSRLMSVLYEDVAGAVDRVDSEYRGVGAKMAALMIQGIVGSTLEVSAALENMFIRLAESGVMATVAKGMGSFTAALTSLSDANPQLLEFGTYALMGLAVIGPLGIAIAGAAAALALMLNPLTIVVGGLAALATLNWSSITSGFRTFGKFFRLDLSPATVARFGRLKDSLKDFIGSLGGSASMASFQAIGARLGTGLANIVNAVANYDFGPRLRDMSNSIQVMAMTRVDGLMNVGRAIGDLMERAGPFFSTAFQSIAIGVGSGLDTVGSALQVIASFSSRAASGVTDFFTAFTSGISDETLAILGRGADSLLSEFARDLRNLNTELQGYKAAIDGLDMGWFSGFGADAAKGFNQIVLEFSRVPEAIRAEIEVYKGYIATMGTYVPDFSSLTNAINAVVGVINTIATAVNGAIEALGRLSPSMVTGAANARAGGAAVGAMVPKAADPNAAIANLPSQIPGKAGGGVVRRGHVYEINERGQEYFSPGSNGRIIPNNRIGGGGVGGRIVIENKLFLDSAPIVSAVRRDESRQMSRKKQTGLNRPME